MRSRLRIGAVSYLNTKPLVHGLSELAPCAEIVYAVPSRLADALARGQLDIALVPSIEYLLHPEYQIVSDACIACRGPVLSVKLLSRVPLDRIETLALDEGSRTSVALVQILLAHQYGIRPRLQSLPVGADARSLAVDAVLLIGDRAIHAPRDVFSQQWDLGDQWCRWAGLPFVFAMWTARPGVETIEIETSLRKARDAGVSRLVEIAREQAPCVDMSVESCLAYLRDNLHFYLGPREREGLRRFGQLVTQLEQTCQEPSMVNRGPRPHLVGPRAEGDS
jgi:chorismate dehydratase